MRSVRDTVHIFGVKQLLYAFAAVLYVLDNGQGYNRLQCHKLMQVQLYSANKNVDILIILC